MGTHLLPCACWWHLPRRHTPSTGVTSSVLFLSIQRTRSHKSRSSTNSVPGLEVSKTWGLLSVHSDTRSHLIAIVKGKKKMLWQPHCNLTTLTENPVGWTATVYYITHCLSSLSLAVITEDKSGCENGFLSGGNLMINVTKCLLSYDLSLMAG